MRGGVHAPLSTSELEMKFMDKALYGGWTRASAERLQRLSRDLFTLPRLNILTECRS
jgi:hypothetical protein